MHTPCYCTVNRAVAELDASLEALKTQCEDWSAKSKQDPVCNIDIARSFSVLRDIRGELEDSLEFKLAVDPSIPLYWRLKHESDIESFFNDTKVHAKFLLRRNVYL